MFRNYKYDLIVNKAPFYPEVVHILEVAETLVLKFRGIMVDKITDSLPLMIETEFLDFTNRCFRHQTLLTNSADCLNAKQ